MKENKVVNLQEYKSQKVIESQIKELEEIGIREYASMSPTEQKGYDNFMKLLKAVDKKHNNKDQFKKIRFFLDFLNLSCNNTCMNFEELFKNIDLSSPLTDEELEYLDIIGVNPILVTPSENTDTFNEKKD